MAGVTGIEVLIQKNQMAQILDALTGSVEQKIWDLAGQIVDAASANAPVDTGALSQSLFRISEKQSTFEDVAGTASGLNAKAVIVDEPSAGKGEVLVGPAVAYGAPVENGAPDRPAQPYLVPAVEQVAASASDVGFTIDVGSD